MLNSVLWGCAFGAFIGVLAVMLRNPSWRLIAWIVSRPRVSEWIIARAKRTPYGPIYGRKSDVVYMDRWWLFNPYSKDAEGRAGPARWSWLPSIRVHHIMEPDDDGHMHDHPWNARTIVMRGGYEEERPRVWQSVLWSKPPDTARERFIRTAGYTGRVLFGEYHRISAVSHGGVYTLWFTWRYRGTWGFLVNGKKVPYRTYLAERE